MKLKELLRFFLGVPLTIIAFIFIGKIFLDNRESIMQSLLGADLLLFLLGVVLMTCFFATKSYIWLGILKARGFVVPTKKTLYLYSISEAKRYIPGSVFAFLSRMGTHEEIPKKETIKGIGIEAILLALSAIVVSIPSLMYLINRIEPNLQKFTLPLLVIGILIAAIIFFGKSKFRKSFFNYIDLFFIYILAWSFYSVGSYFIAFSLFPINLNDITVVASLFTASWLCGYLLFLTPMGLGVRELVATFGLSFFTPAGVASVIAIMSRVGMILGELLYLLLTRIYSSSRDHEVKIKVNPYLIVVIFSCLLYFVYFSYFSIARHNAFLSGRFDLGNMAQTVWNTSQGRFFMLTNPDGVENMSRLGVHSDYLLVIISPLYFIWADPRMLLLFQSAALATGSIAVYFLARKILKREILATAFAFSYLANFWLHEQNIFDFHAVTIATPLILFSLLFLTGKKYFFFGVFLALAVTTKENVALIISAFGLYFLKEKKWLLGTALAVLGAATFYYLSSYAIPNARGEAHFALGTYSQLGDSTGAIIKNLILNPSLAYSQLANDSTFLYFHRHLIPFGYLPLLSPFYFLFVAPDMAIYLLSSNYEYRSYQYHFGAVIIPFMIFASILGAKLLLTKVKSENLPKALFYYVIISAFLTMYYYSPILGMKNADNSPFESDSSQKIREYLNVIPENASVASSNNLGAHLSHREHIYTVPYGMDRASFIALYKENERLVSSVDIVNYVIVIEDKENNFYLYKRVASPTSP